MPSPSAPVRKMGQLKTCSSSPAVLQLLFKGDSAPLQDHCGDKARDWGKRSLTCETDVARANSPTLASRADTHTPSSPNSDTKSSKTTSPVRVPRSNATAQEEALAEDHNDGAAEQLLEDVAPADERRREWIANVQKKFGADPHYHVRIALFHTPIPRSVGLLYACTRCVCAHDHSNMWQWPRRIECVGADDLCGCAGNVEIRAAGAQGADYVHDGGAEGGCRSTTKSAPSSITTASATARTLRSLWRLTRIALARKGFFFAAKSWAMTSLCRPRVQPHARPVRCPLYAWGGDEGTRSIKPPHSVLPRMPVRRRRPTSPCTIFLCDSSF